MSKYDNDLYQMYTIPPHDLDAEEELQQEEIGIATNLWPHAEEKTLINRQDTFVLGDENRFEQRSFSSHGELARYAASGRLFALDDNHRLRQIQMDYQNGAYSASLSKPAQYYQTSRPAAWKYVINFFFGFFEADIQAYKKKKQFNEACNDMAENTQYGLVINREGEMEPALGQNELLRNEVAEHEENLLRENQPAENQPEPIKLGLEPYDSKKLKSFVKRLDYPEKELPVSTKIGLTGEKMGVLVALSQASADLQYQKTENDGVVTTVRNDPDNNYTELIDTHFIQGKQLPDAHIPFIASGKELVRNALAAAEENDFAPLGKIIAQGLCQNNKFLQAQRKLSDAFSAHAILGAMALQIMESHPALKAAVLTELGNSSTQLDIAKAARNIHAMRVEIMPRYRKMVATYGKYNVAMNMGGGPSLFSVNAEEPGRAKDVAKVCLLSQIEVRMNSGNFDLENEVEFTRTRAVIECVRALQSTNAVSNFLADKKRCDKLQNPIAMKKLFDRAFRERAEKAQIKQQRKVVDIDAIEEVSEEEAISEHNLSVH